MLHLNERNCQFPEGVCTTKDNQNELPREKKSVQTLNYHCLLCCDMQEDIFFLFLFKRKVNFIGILCVDGLKLISFHAFKSSVNDYFDIIVMTYTR